MSDLDQANPPVTRNLHKNRDELRGDLLVRGFWGRGTDCIIAVRVTDIDAKSNLSKDHAKVLEAHEKEKKRKYLRSHVLSNAVLSLRSWSPPMAS
jgi:hypothetical protein